MFSARKFASVACIVMAQFPAVPLAMYPAVTDGVTLTVLVKTTLVPLLDAVAPLDEMDAGAVAVPDEIVLVAALS